MLLSNEISSQKFLKKQFDLVVIFGFIAIVISIILNLTSLIHRFQYDIFLLILLASALNMISNAVSIVIYSRKKDLLNFISIFITLILCGLVVGCTLIDNSKSKVIVDLEMCIAYVVTMVCLLLARVSFMMRDGLKKIRD
jgi:hypothetical protein